MKYIFNLISALALTIFLAGSYCKPSKETQELINSAKDTFGIIPASMPGGESDTPEKIALGKKLYFDKALSLDGTVSCNSCHNLNNKGSGTDNLPTSLGVKGQKGNRNAPTVLNAGYHLAQFWDGRAKDLQEQAKGPILNPVEMAMPNPEKVVQKIKEIEEYGKLFAAAFPGTKDPISFDNLASAIASFERTLKTNDRFDDFQNGNGRALSKDEQDGLKLFMETGCIDCHNGPLLGGNSYRKIGLVHEFETSDKGRYEVTKEKDDMFVFKVPSLRNVARTAPYFHNGSIVTINEAVKKMAWHQLGKELTDAEINSIITFLKTLSDKK